MKIAIKCLVKIEGKILKELKEHLEKIFNLPVKVDFQEMNCQFALSRMVIIFVDFQELGNQLLLKIGR